jgi:hypothetical protein
MTLTTGPRATCPRPQIDVLRILLELRMRHAGSSTAEDLRRRCGEQLMCLRGADTTGTHFPHDSLRKNRSVRRRGGDSCLPPSPRWRPTRAWCRPSRRCRSRDAGQLIGSMRFDEAPPGTAPTGPPMTPPASSMSSARWCPWVPRGHPAAPRGPTLRRTNRRVADALVPPPLHLLARYRNLGQCLGRLISVGRPCRP